MKRRMLLSLLAIACLIIPTASAQVPELITYRGFLTEAAGDPLDNRAATLTFRLYDTPDGGSPLWLEKHTGVVINDGVFLVVLGGAEELNEVPFDRPLHLGIAVGDTTADERSPRVALTAAPYSLGVRGLRVAPGSSEDGPNVIAGASVNSTAPGVVGATIAGGGDPLDDGQTRPNEVTDRYGSIGGGHGNTAAEAATVGGGQSNTASGRYATVGGGFNNTASAFRSIVSGGEDNRATGVGATVPGGVDNRANGDFSFAAGVRARAEHRGAFVWGDFTAEDFASTAENQFLIRAIGGVGIGTNAPSSPLTVAGVVASTEGGFRFPDGTVQTSAALGWDLSGNAGTDPSTDFIGTTDAVALEIRVDDRRAMRFEPTSPDEGPNVIAGSAVNSVAPGVFGATISGGGDPVVADHVDANQVTSHFGTVGGGAGNTASQHAAVAGGRRNTASGVFSTVGGGFSNAASRTHSTVGGGERNAASSKHSTVGGGERNAASSEHSTVGGGERNKASGLFSTVGGGVSNEASRRSSTVGGGGGNTASGISATVPGGQNNAASGLFSFAAGRRAKAEHDGAFVWADHTNADFVSTAEDQFLIRAIGGVGIGTSQPREDLHVFDPDRSSVLFLGGQRTVGPHGLVFDDDNEGQGVQLFWRTAPNRLVLERTSAGSGAQSNNGAFFYDRDDHVFFFDGRVGIDRVNPAHPLQVGTNTTNGNGAHVTSGGVWTNGSSRQSKEDVETVDPRNVLEQVVQMPVSRWRYKGEDGEHLGPMAEDFFAAFELGSDPRYIGTVDADGVALAAIQGLYQVVQAQQAEIAALRALVEGMVASQLESSAAVGNTASGAEPRPAATAFHVTDANTGR